MKLARSAPKYQLLRSTLCCDRQLDGNWPLRGFLPAAGISTQQLQESTGCSAARAGTRARRVRNIADRRRSAVVDRSSVSPTVHLLPAQGKRSGGTLHRATRSNSTAVSGFEPQSVWFLGETKSTAAPAGTGPRVSTSTSQRSGKGGFSSRREAAWQGIKQ